MHALLRAVEEPHVDLPEVVLREFARQPLETHSGRTVLGRTAALSS